MNKLRAIAVFFSLYLILFQTAWTPISTEVVKPFSGTNFPAKDPTCTPGQGTMWVNGPLDQQKALEIQDDLLLNGILADVEAKGYGEIDSCGTYIQKGFDFKITLETNSKTNVSPDDFQDNVDDIQSIVNTNAGKNPGNIVILDSEGRRLNSEVIQVTDKQRKDNNAPSAKATTINVYVIVYNPVLGNGQTLSQYMHWNDPTTITQETIDFFQQASNGNLLYTIAYTSIVTNGWPELIDGYIYNESTYLQVLANPTLHHIPTDVNYNKIFDNPTFDICGKVNRGEIDEVWIYGGPWFGFYESRLVGPNAFTLNSPPLSNSNCSKMVPVMSPSMERTTHEAIHNFTHRAEAVMSKVYGGWAQNRTAHNWDRFGLVKAQSSNYSYSGCGSSHYPPNGVQDYDYANLTNTLSNCEDFLNFPALNDPLQVVQPVNCNVWGCNGLGYYDYWFSHFPAADGCTDYIANDWWKYFAYPANALVPARLCDAWIISGNAGIGGTTLNYNDDKARTVTTDNLGNYYLPVPYGWSGSITPLRTSYTFSPPSLSFTNLTSDISEQNFIATWGCPTITEWKGEYWGNTTMSGSPIVCRNDTAINFPWGGGSPDPLISADYFSARWTRTLYFAPGLYRFRMSHDDGARLYVDGVIKIDVMGTCCVWDQVDIPLSGNHDIRMEMFENNGGAGAQLEISTLSLYQPEIQVLGNNVVILDGDLSASTTDHTNFGNINTSESTLTRTFTIQNTGTLDLVLNGNPKVEISGTNSSDFTLTEQPSSPLSPSGSTTFTVLFDPSASGVRTATINIVNNDSNENPYNFAIQGTGVISPEIGVMGNDTSILSGDVTPSNLDFTAFGNVEITSNGETHTFTIFNTGDSNLSLTGSPSKIAISGTDSSDFTISASPLSPIAPGGMSTFTITFTPGSIGIRNAILSISNNDTDENPFTFSIQGVGVDSANTHTVTFDANGGSTPNPTNKQVTLNSTYGTLPSTSRSGYTFAGWFTAATGGTEVTTSTMVSNTSDHTLYAQWTALPNHIVTFNSNTGSGSMSPQVSNIPAMLTSNAFSRVGYSFTGWNTVSNGTGTAFANDALFDFNVDLMLYAQWVANTYTVTFDANGGSTPVTTNKLVTFNSTYGTLATTSRTGYTFAGWFTATSGGTKVTTSTIVSNASNQTLYAQWTANNYTVLFDSNGGSPYFPASKVVAFGSPYGTLATASRTGYAFAGWFTETSGGTQVTPSTIVSTASNHTLYAQWTANNYIITFNSDGGSSVDPIIQAFGSSIVAPADPIKAGYTFAGWSPAIPATMPVGGITLTAQWTELPTVSSITLAFPSPTSASSVDFTVTFSKDVQDVDTNGSDFSLFVSGMTGASIIGVTPVSASVYTVSVNTGSGNGTIRLDVPNTATISDLSSNALSGLPFTSGEVYSINKSGGPIPTTATFGDVTTTHPYFADIEILYANGYTAGCSSSPLLFCPETTMNRAQSAVFMVRGNFGISYSPPAAPWTTFGDDFAPGPWAQPWAQGMFDAGLTAGCSSSPRLFCPWEEMPRFQAAVFGMRLRYGNSYPPPAGTGTVFADINGSEWYAGWVEQAYSEGLLPACGSSGGKPLFCPNDLVPRGLAAYMIVRARNLSMP